MLEVAAAIIFNEQGQILIARRKEGKSLGGMWEFPGGKLETGESPQACIARELQEEMNIAIAPGEIYGINDYADETMPLRLIACKAFYKSGKSGEIRLTDHDEYRWVSRDELDRFRFAPADVKFVRMLQQGI